MGDSADFARRREDVRAGERQNQRRRQNLILRAAKLIREDKYIPKPLRKKLRAAGVFGQMSPLGKILKSAVADPIDDAIWSFTNPVARLTGKGRAAEQSLAFPGSASGAAVVPIVGRGRFLNVESYNWGGVPKSIDDLERASDDLGEYALSLDELKADHIGDEYDLFGDPVESEVGRAVRAMTPQMRAEAQRVAKSLATRLKKAVEKSEVGAYEGQDPAQMLFDEFMTSPLAAWHHTTTAPGLGTRAQGVHAGTATAAFDRYVMSQLFSNRPRMAPRFIPVALRGRVAENTLDDPGSSFVMRDVPTSDVVGRWVGADPRMASRVRRRVNRVDVQPYENSVEDIGSISFEASHPGAVRTHLDTIRDYIAATGEVPAGLQSYRNQPQLLRRLQREIAAAKQTRRAFNERQARKNAFLTAVKAK